MKIEAKNKIKESIEYLKRYSAYDDNINKAIRCINEAIEIIKNEEPSSPSVPSIPDDIVYDNPTYGDKVITTNGEIYTISKLFDEGSPYYTDNQGKDEVYYNNEEQRWYLNKRIGITQTININYTSTNDKEFIKLYDANGTIMHKVVWGTTMNYDNFGVNVENEKVLTTARDIGDIPEGAIAIVAYNTTDKFLIRNPNGVSPEIVSELLSNQTIRYYLENEILDIPLLKKGETISVKSITLNKHSIGLDKNSTYKVKYNVYPTTATNKKVNLYSSDENIAIVDNTGNIQTLSDGEVTITAVTEDGNYKDKISIYVNNNTTEEQLFKGAYIQIYYYNWKPFSDEEIIIPYYIDDNNLSWYQEDNTNKTFTLIVNIDGKDTRYENIKAGDNEINLGILSEGEHYFSLQGIDNSNGAYGMRIFKEIWCVNRDTYPISESETYIMNNTDLSTYNINNTNAEDDNSCENTKLGLNQLMNNCKEQGFRKLVLLPGTYRVNCPSREDCIIIPTDFTLDLNGSTIKRKPDLSASATYGKTTIRMIDCHDSHVINGTIEDDSQERIDAGADGYSYSLPNGEGFNTLYSTGGRYWSYEDLIIKNAVGHSSLNLKSGNSSDFMSSKYSFDETKQSIINDEDKNIEKCYILNGVKYPSEKYVTSEMIDIKEKFNKCGYLMFGNNSGYAYIRGISQEVYYHFYNEDMEFVTSICTMQYRVCRIPYGCRYVRVTINSYEDHLGGGYIYYAETGSNIAYKNIAYENCRTTALAPTTSRGLLIEGCSYKDCGRKITPSSLDFEDGWQQSIDVYYRNNTLVSNNAGSSATVITVAGVNHVYENNINHTVTGDSTIGNGSIIFKHLVTGSVVRNNDDIAISGHRYYSQYSKFNRIYNNKALRGSIANWNNNLTDNDELHEAIAPSSVIKNCYLPSGASGDIDFRNFIFRKCNINGAINNCVAENCNISGGYYFSNNMIAKNCNFYNFDDINTQIELGFNSLNKHFEFTECAFKSPVSIRSHNSFNSGLWDNCTFEKEVTINTENATVSKYQIQFNNCIFKENIIINIGTNTYAQFNNCTFLRDKTFYKNAEERCEFNDSVPTNIGYIKLTPSLDYMNINNKYNLDVYTLPMNISDENLIYTFSENGVTFNKVKSEIISTTAKDITITCTDSISNATNSCLIHFVDVDYSIGYINNDGNISNTVGWFSDNRYIEISGAITVTSECSVGIKGIRITEYDSNKNIVENNTIATSTRSVTKSLNSNTRFIRIGFNTNAARETKLPELFSTYSVTNNL